VGCWGFWEGVTVSKRRMERRRNGSDYEWRMDEGRELDGDWLICVDRAKIKMSEKSEYIGGNNLKKMIKSECLFYRISFFY